MPNIVHSCTHTWGRRCWSEVIVEAAARKVTADMVAEETPDLNSFLDKVVLELTASAISHTELKTEAPKIEL